MTQILLVRHGQDHDNAGGLINGRRDTSLTELGQAQARSVADSLFPKKIDCVYTSPLKRARETAAIISERLGIERVYVESDLVERDYGVLTGRPISDILTLAEKIVESHGFKYIVEARDIEDYAHLWKRAGNILQKIRERHNGQTVLVVAHNEIIKMIRGNFDRSTWEDELSLPPLANGQIISLGP